MSTRRAARREGESLAATVAEPARGAYVDWSRRPGRASRRGLHAAASRGRRYRAADADHGRARRTRGSAARAGVRPGPGGRRARRRDARRGERRQPRQRRDRRRPPSARCCRGQSCEPAPDRLPTRSCHSLQQVDGAADRDEPGALGPRRRATAAEADLPTAARRAETPKEPAEPEPPPKTVEELLAELDELVGLTDVKAEIHRQAAVLRVEGLREDAGLAAPTITRHLVFIGNPGTGKTTVARLVAGIYRALGLLSKGQLVEVDRSELVAGYLGQTAMKTAEVVKSPRAACCSSTRPTRSPATSTAPRPSTPWSRRWRTSATTWSSSSPATPSRWPSSSSQNPGLESRFRTTIDFADYTDDELVADLRGAGRRRRSTTPTSRCLDRLRELLAARAARPTFGNARFVRNLFEAAIGRHAWRLRDVDEPTVEQLRTLLADDLDPSRRPGGPTEPVEWEPAPMDHDEPTQEADVTQAQQAPAPCGSRARSRRSAPPPPAPEAGPRTCPACSTAGRCRGPGLPALRRPRRTLQLLGWQATPGRRQHRAAGAGAEHPVLAVPRRRAGHHRLPRRRARAARAAGGLRRRRSTTCPPDHRRRPGAAGRPRGAGRAQHRGHRLHERDRAGPRQQPPGLPGRRRVPPRRRRRPAREALRRSSRR